MFEPRKSWRFTRELFAEFTADRCTRMAAAMAYFTIFSLPAMLLVIIMVAGAVWGEKAVQGELETQLTRVLGERSADAVQAIIANASRPGGGNLWATAIGFGLLIFGATRAFGELQDALNTAWEVKPARGGVKGYAIKRLMSFLMLVGLAVMLLAMLIASTVLTAFGEVIKSIVENDAIVLVIRVAQVTLELLLLTVFFGALYMILPDAKVRWRDVRAGAIFATLLFVGGKFAIGFYLGRSEPGSAYGAAGSLALLLIWIYYSSVIVLLGAEFTQVWARMFGPGIQPEEHAVRVRVETIEEPPGEGDPVRG